MMIDLFSLPLLVQVSDFPYFTDCVVFFSRTDPYVLQEQLIKDGAYYIVTPEGTVTWDEEWESGVNFSNVFTNCCIDLNHICFIYFCVSHVSLAWAKYMTKSNYKYYQCNIYTDFFNSISYNQIFKLKLNLLVFH